MRRRRARRILFSLVPLLVVLGSAELGLRAAGWPPRPGHFDHNEPYWVLDPDQTDREVPHPEEDRSFRLSTDARGLRPPWHPGPKAAGAWRVLAMGCSTTLGWGVDDAESYPARLEARARAAGFDDVEVLNGGQPGYTTMQGLWLWDTLLHDSQPDVVLLGFVVQDARRAAYTDRSQAILQQDKRFLKDHVLWKSRIYLGLRALIGSVQLRAKERPQPHDPAAGRAQPDDTHGVFRVPPSEYAANLTALVARARSLGARPVLFGYPLEQAGYTAEHRATLAEVAAAREVPLFDPQAAMTAAAAQEALYFEHDRGHANAEGNDLIATWMLDFLEGQGLLGPAREP